MCADLNNLRYVGWDTTITHGNAFTTNCYRNLFSDETMDMISNTITESLDGVDSRGRKIKVSKQAIRDLLNSVYQENMSRGVGDIFSRYQVVNEESRDDYRDMIHRTIEIAVSQIRTQLEMEENNNKLSIWNTVLGDFNENGLRSHAPIKTRKKKPDSMLFNMNY
jgi:hypothetical protein